MPPLVFGRPVTVPSWASALRELASSAPEYRALAQNFSHDQRVPIERERSFAQIGAAAADAHAFETAVRQYHAAKVRTDAEFLDPLLNAPNILSWAAGGAHVVNKDSWIGRVLDLSGMYRVYSSARARTNPAFRTLPDREDDLDSWLRVRLTRSTADIETFLHEVFKAMWESHQTRAFQPTWVAWWHDLETVLSDPPARWLDLTGLSPAATERWVILLRYRVRDAGQLVRPTQLDAGWYAYHYPTPPEAAIGHAMDLASTTAAVAPVSEFVHQEIHHTVSQWREAGARVGRVALRGTSLPDARRRHWDLLHSRYMFHLAAWMPRDL